MWFDDGRYYHLLFLMKPGVLLLAERHGHGPLRRHARLPPERADGRRRPALLVPVDRTVDHITGVRGVLLEDLGLAVPAEVTA